MEGTNMGLHELPKQFISDGIEPMGYETGSAFRRSLAVHRSAEVAVASVIANLENGNAEFAPYDAPSIPVPEEIPMPVAEIPQDVAA